MNGGAWMIGMIRADRFVNANRFPHSTFCPWSPAMRPHMCPRTAIVNVVEPSEVPEHP